MDTYFWRQFFLSVAGLFLSLCMGMMLAYPTVLNASILHSNTSDIKTTSDQASWISASNGISGIAGSLILPPLFQLWGRKAAHILINLCLFLGWIIFPFAKDISALYAARIVQGFAVGGMYIHATLISEYVHPKRRGYFITYKKIFIAIGTLASHAMQPFLTWRQIAIAAVFPPLIAIILTFFWPESPHYLALKGRYKDCEKSFRWLNGNSEESEQHLRTLIDTRRKKVQRRTKSSLLGYMKTFIEKDFLKAVLISSLLTLSLDLCGRYYLFAYVLEIMTKLVGDKTVAFYFSMGADTITILGIILSSFVIRYFDRRVLLFAFGSLTVVLMLLISLIVYLNTLFHLPSAYMWFTASVIIVQSTIVSVGVAPISFILIGEIFPLDHKGKGITVAGVVFTSFYALTLKATPVLMEHTGLHGTFTIYALLLIVCLFWLNKVLPETKDKTLMEIENELNESVMDARVVEKDTLIQKT